MKKMLLVFVVLILFLSMSSCTRVESGYVGVKVYLLGSDKGDFEILGLGRHWIGINEDLFLFPTFKQNYVWTADNQEGSPNDESITFSTSEGLKVRANLGITYSIDPEKVVTLFQKYRRGVEEITDSFLRNYVRDALNTVASTYKVDEVYGEGKEKLMKEINNRVTEAVAKEGIIVEKIYLIGSFDLPEEVNEALKNKVAAIQKAEQREYELRDAKAEAKKMVELAEAEAKVIALKTRSVTPLTVKYEQVKAQYKAIEKWNGVLPTMSMGSTTPIINLGQ